MGEDGEASGEDQWEAVPLVLLTGTHQQRPGARLNQWIPVAGEASWMFLFF
jgi:hypothetical protein